MMFDLVPMAAFASGQGAGGLGYAFALCGLVGFTRGSVAHCLNTEWLTAKPFGSGIGLTAQKHIRTANFLKTLQTFDIAFYFAAFAKGSCKAICFHPTALVTLSERRNTEKHGYEHTAYFIQHQYLLCCNNWRLT